ncbi:MAG TPA: hypothetical protein PK771_12305, partial [Spirochaetota bacterium]|nr:hypothetical protein [Spirochaetota bacterium]
MKLYITILFLSILSYIYSYDEVSLWDKLKIRDEKILFDSKNFILKDKIINFNEISHILLNITEGDKVIDKQFKLGEVTPSDLIERGKIL